MGIVSDATADVASAPAPPPQPTPGPSTGATTKAAVNNQAIGQTQSLIAASQDAANRGDFAAAAQLRDQANAAYQNIQSAGAKSAVGAALGTLNQNIANPTLNVQRGGGGYDPPPPPKNPPPANSAAAKAQANNQAIGKSQALIAAANDARNRGQSDLANKLIEQAREAQKAVTSPGAQKALTEAMPPKIEKATVVPITPEDDGDDEPEAKQPTVFRPTGPTTAPSPPKPKIVKNPNRDVIDLSREQFALSSISRLVFEQVGSIELANISRRDTIEGQNSYYELISNLSSIRKNFDPTSIISRQKPNQNISSNYTIRLNEKVPDDQYLERNNLSDFYYIDSNGDLVIELDNLSADEIIDIEIATSGTISLVDEA